MQEREPMDATWRRGGTYSYTRLLKGRNTSNAQTSEYVILINVSEDQVSVGPNDIIKMCSPAGVNSKGNKENTPATDARVNVRKKALLSAANRLQITRC